MELNSGVAPGDVAVQLRGGLGNQMFQVATGFALARRLGSYMWVDCRALPLLARRRNTTARSVEVFDFNVSSQVAADKDLNAIGINWRLLPPRAHWIPHKAWGALSRSALLLSKPRCEVRVESSLNYNSKNFEYLAAESATYLIGYWQSARYFDESRAELLRQFVPASPLSSELNELRESIVSQTSLVMHVRRGDLVTNRSARNFHGLLPSAYYEKALQTVQERLPVEHTFVFSDDPQWCAEELGGLAPMTIVDRGRFPGPSAHHLHVMSAGKAFVLANSSFSWWAAWLSEAHPECVVAPARWFAGSSDLSGPALPEWIKV